MRIAIASGKGGTGKTTVAVNLAYFNRLDLVDLDVEEPNAYIFFKNKDNEVNEINEISEDVFTFLPEVLKDKCTLCGVCRDVCAFHAIIIFDEVEILSDLCHSCKACMYLCPEKAIVEGARKIGEIKTIENGIKLTYGRLRVGEASAVPLIKKVKEKIDASGDVIIDCPPGNSCPVVECIEDSDFVILVAEPSPFSLHDIKITMEIVKKIGVSYGVVINKHGLPFDIEEKLKGVEILGKIPFSMDAAEKYSKGELMIEYEGIFREIYDRVREMMG
ncbi:MAG: AAA family ATPase [Archaeoglobus sp.]|nr:AAA family ATPase [Archaeoglobus sp.]